MAPPQLLAQPALVGVLGVALGHDGGLGATADGPLGHHNAGDVQVARQVEHGVLQRGLADGAQAAGAGAAGERLASDLAQGLVLKLQLNALELEHATVLLDQRVLGLGENAHQVVLGELLGARDDRDAADELGNHAKLVQVLRHDLGHEGVLVLLDLLAELGVEADALLANAVRHDLVQSDEGAAADEQDVGGVDANELLLRVLAATLGRDAGLGALDDLEKGLLHTLAGDVARDGEVLGLAGDLVDLVYVDDTHLRTLHVAVGGGDELEQDVLHVLTHVAGLGQRSGVGNGEGHLEEAREGLGQKGLARAGGTEQQNVALGDLNLLLALLDLVVTGEDAAVVVVDGHAHGALGLLLAHDVLGELVVNLVRGGKLLYGGLLGNLHDIVHVKLVHRLADHVGTGTNALVADEDAVGALDQLAHLAAALVAEGAVHLLVAEVAVVVHGCH